MIRKEYIVVRIDVSPDGGPYVLISFSDPRDAREGSQPMANPNVMGFGSMDDLVKNLQKTFTGLSRQTTDGLTTVVKMEMREYEDSGLRVGDKVHIDINKIEKEGV